MAQGQKRGRNRILLPQEMVRPSRAPDSRSERNGTTVYTLPSDAN
jgi:hypothetical protein